jgi:hypothetical protein
VDDRPDLEAEVIRPGKQATQVELFSALPQNEEGGAMMPPERLDTQSKGFETLMNEEMDKQKSELGKKKKRAAAVKKKKEEKKKKGDYYEKEAASCIQFCIWNCKEGHRCSSLFKKYNQYLSRPSRLILLFTSWMMFVMITGYLMEGNSVILNLKLNLYSS